MVVVLDKLRPEDEECGGDEQALLPAPGPQNKPKKGHRWAKCKNYVRTRRCWTKIATALFVVIIIKGTILRRNQKDFEFLQSLVEDPPTHGEEVESGFGCLNVALNHNKTEKLFLSIPSPKSALDASRKYATHPHLAGSSEDFEDAKVILELFQTQFGISHPEEEPIFSAGSNASRKATLDISLYTKPKAWIDVYYPLLNTPLERRLEILDENGEVSWSADLVEDGDARDRDAAEYRDAVPTYHGLSKDGEVEGELVFANYGRKEDFDELVAAGVDLKGKIVITRYGAIFRGLKIRGAAELGAAGVLIYDDPRNDGAVTVENGYLPYPAGPARNPSAVQRGSVQYISLYPGDPTTPGYPAYENATRGEGDNMPTIPSLPISWQNAERLLEEIGSNPGNRLLNGVASKRKVRLVNHVDNKITPIWNTMAVIPGHIKSEVIIIGNHRDAWVMGAADPTSGTVSVHEIIRGFGALLRSGWRPLRTILFASWDAEEQGLVGSTEWGEDFADWISAHAVVYLNVDVSVAGSQWFAGSSPSLAHIIRATAKDTPHPTKPGKTLWDARSDVGPYEGDIDSEVAALFNATAQKKDTHNIGVHPMGSGSDFTVFLQRLGIASSDQSFGLTPHDAAYHYHSIYDSQRWQELYADPGFHKHVAIAKFLGLLALRIADFIIFPLNTTQYSLELDDYLDEVKDIADSLSEKVDLVPLRKSIKKLQKASLELDVEKRDAEHSFRKLLEQMKRNMLEIQNRSCQEEESFASWLKGLVGIKSETSQPQDCWQPKGLRMEESILDWYVREAPAGALSEDDKLDFLLSSEHHSHKHSDMHAPFSSLGKDVPIRKFIKALKRVGRANQKLRSFEQGFISEAGIPGREWYRHLGVAPGKYLGYGATTLPALTEALTVEHNATLAESEAARLKDLIDKLALKLTA